MLIVQNMLCTWTCCGNQHWPGWTLISDKALRQALFLSSPLGTGLTRRKNSTPWIPEQETHSYYQLAWENVLNNGRDVGDLVEEVKLALVEVFSWARQRAYDLLHHLFQQLTNVGCKSMEVFHLNDLPEHLLVIINKKQQRNQQLRFSFIIDQLKQLICLQRVI